MFCEKCGHNNLDGAKFCAGCGAQLTAPRLDKAPFEETPSTTNGYAQPEYTQPAYTQPESAQPQYSQPTYQQPESVQPQYQYTQPQYGWRLRPSSMDRSMPACQSGRKSR